MTSKLRPVFFDYFRTMASRSYWMPIFKIGREANWLVALELSFA